MSAASFAVVLITIDARILLYVLLYAVLSTGFIACLGRKLVRLNYSQLCLNASFRYFLTRVRDNAESIVFYRGERSEWALGVGVLIAAVRNQYRVIRVSSAVTSVAVVLRNFSSLAPYLLLWAVCFKGEIEFGVFTQVQIAFSVVMSAFSFIVFILMILPICSPMAND